VPSTATSLAPAATPCPGAPTAARGLRRQGIPGSNWRDDPEVRAGMRRVAQQRTWAYRTRGSGSDWRAHLEQHRDELRRLKLEVNQVKADMKAQARRAAGDAKAAKDEVKAVARDAGNTTGPAGDCR
jgi:hypothetical protein